MAARRVTSKQVARSALVAERRAKAVELKRQGLSNIAVGHYLAADPAIRPAGAPPVDMTTGEHLGWPQGYGVDMFEVGDPPPGDYQLSRMVSEDLRRAFGDRAKTRDAEVDLMREEMENDLTAIAEAMFEKALREKDPATVNAWLKVQERRAKVWGLDAAVRTEITGKNGAPVEVRNLSDKDLEELLAAYVGTPGIPVPAVDADAPDLDD